MDTKTGSSTDPIKVTPKTFVPKSFTPEPPVTFKEKPLENVTQPSLTVTKVTLPKALIQPLQSSRSANGSLPWLPFNHDSRNYERSGQYRPS